MYTIDDDCLPAVGPDGQLVNPMEGHARNLLSPATPYFFNTVYDPYRDGSDFVRGYPYSLRRGVTTAVSHGLWLNNYDYDAPTQLLKVNERNLRYVDATQTVPKGVLYPLCSMNVAFRRELIGPAFMQGLMGVGQPWSRYDDMWAGWASKTVSDHIGVGCKTGAPYIKHNKASNPFVNLRKEYKGLEWQEVATRFFDTVKLSDESRSDAGSAFQELADRVETSLGYLNPYFARLAQSMRLWVDVWRDAQAGVITFKPSRSSQTESTSRSSASIGIHDSRSSDSGQLDCVTETVTHIQTQNSSQHAAVERDRCVLSFPDTTCTSFSQTSESDLKASDVEAAARPHSRVVVIKCGIGTPFRGDRANNLLRLVHQLSAVGGYRIVFLMDVTSSPSVKVTDALASILAPLIVPYTKRDIETTFPTKSLKKPPRARAMIKYYEVYSWSWWYHRHGRNSTEMLWVVEDDTVFSGNWGSFFRSLDGGIPTGSDLVVFREFCTPPFSWPWLNWMHEGWDGLKTVGQVLETWMTIYGASKRFMDEIVNMQLRGITGHIEWFPQTVALRQKHRMVFVQHALKSSGKLQTSCPSHPEIKAQIGGTFNYCCSAAGSTTDAENWFEGWRKSGKCVAPMLLHPVKADVCNRFATNGYGRGCWKRQISGGEVQDTLVMDSKTDLKTLIPFSAGQL